MDTRELAHRSANGIDVYLLWHPDGDWLTVVVDDCRAESSFVLLVEDGQAPLDVYHHPFAYAAARAVGATIPLEVE